MAQTERSRMRAIEKRLRPHLDENAASLWFEKWLQIHAGGHPASYFGLYRCCARARISPAP